MTIAKVQHYVPQFLLRNFGSGKKDQVWVFDKATNRSFLTNAKNVASESRFYDFEVDGEKRSLEPWLCQVEGDAQKVVSAILASDSVADLDNDSREVLAGFMAVQFTRTRAFREQWIDFPRLLRDHFAELGQQVEPGSQAEGFLQDITENQSKLETARIIAGAPQTYGDHFLDKEWLLIATSKKHPFMLSDNPVARQNLIDIPHRGNLGLTTPGIEIYMPLSPTRALAMWSSELTEMVHRAAASLAAGGPEARDPLGPLALSDALLSGQPVQYSPANVENFNSLQTVWSERYVFSSINDFEMVKSMTDEWPDLRQGPRVAVA